MDTSALAKRMKKYEAVPKNTLMRRTPVIIRIDGRAFHTFTKGFQKPFDDVLIRAMQDTMKYLCEHIQGCVFGYTQSDEITLVLTDYKKLTSEAWFDYEVQKMCSIVASMATLEFNRKMKIHSILYANHKPREGETSEDITKQFGIYAKAVNAGAMFDARVFNLPKEEVTNNIYWRQLDASRNSIQMLGQANFSHKELQHKSCSDIQDMLMTQKGINWNDLPTYQKRGSCCVRNKIVVKSNGETETCRLRNPKENENAWIIDKEIPIFKGDGRNYIDSLILIGGDAS